MVKLLKRTAIVLAGLVGVIVVVAVVLSFLGGSRLNRSYSIDVTPVAVSTDSATVARGRHLVEAVTLCLGCHGENLEGDVLFEAPLIATVYASNLTSGRGGIGATYGAVDYVRAIRHGINADGRGLMIMHSDAYHHLGEADLGAIISYIRSVPPVHNELPPTRRRFLGKVFVALGLFDSDDVPLIPAEVIDHAAPYDDVPAPGVTAEYGKYLVSIAVCSMCHGSDLTGGPPFDEGAPPAPNIVVVGGWSDAQFVGAIRTGVTPYGKELDPEAMPWEVYGKMTDAELMAIRLYLASL